MTLLSSGTREQIDRSGLLRQLKRLVTEAVPKGGIPAGARILDRLERDLLPRTAGGDRYLVAGIVGPNNAGKSSLFNFLAGAALSPADPAGGTTRRLFGTAHPALLEQLAAEPSLSRFPLRRLGPEPDGKAAQGLDGPPLLAAELLVVEQAAFPENLLLIDTPDFDSILMENRAASEALLSVADLVITVVTRHSYQNREVVTFLRKWLSHGKPWMLVYNEGIDADSVRAHAGKLGADLGGRPTAIFWAPHHLGIQRGTAALDPQALEPGGKSLRETLWDLEGVAGFKEEALRASLAELRDDVRELAQELRDRGGRAEELLAEAGSRVDSLAEEIAHAA
ncbi:MAG: GTPase, partial [Planctomycetota bacterium]